jgi:hypothetical protein
LEGFNNKVLSWSGVFAEAFEEFVSDSRAINQHLAFGFRHLEKSGQQL